MTYNEELAALTESVSVLQRKVEYMLRDRGLQRDLEFEKKLNELMDSFGCPLELLLEVIVGRKDVSVEARSKLAEIANLEFEIPVEPSSEGEIVAHQEPPKRPASENALAWHEKFGHRSLESWFK